jgi:hypothetical protein
MLPGTGWKTIRVDPHPTGGYILVMVWEARSQESRPE